MCCFIIKEIMKSKIEHRIDVLIESVLSLFLKGMSILGNIHKLTENPFTLALSGHVRLNPGAHPVEPAG